jgi:signal transduction histidine kinase
MSPFWGIFAPHNYFLNPNFTAPMFVASLALIFGLLIYRLEEKPGLNRTILYLCLSLSLWLYAYSFMISARDYPVAVVWGHVLYLGWIAAAVTMFHVSVILTHRYASQRILLTGLYAAGIVFWLLTWNPYLFDGVRSYPFGYYPNAGVLQFVLLIFILTCLVSGFMNMARYHRLIPGAFERSKTRFFMGAFGVAALGYSDILATYDLNFVPSGYFVIFGFVVAVSFFLIRCQQWVIDQRASALESIIQEKTGEISKIIEELRRTQFKLFETGRLSALASLSAGILHQISQPITAIHGFVKFIKKEMKETDTFYKPICLMDEQTVYLKEMLEDLMALIRHRQIKKENIDVNLFLTRATNLLTDELRIKRVNWDTKLGEGLPPVHADGVHLQQIFMNVIINAMQAMATLPPGSKRDLTISSGFDNNSNQVFVSFKDTGPGLSFEDKQQIFEPFFSTKEKGSGIGLALCKDLVAEHGGKIDVESRQGEGTNFIIRFPCAVV